MKNEMEEKWKRTTEIFDFFRLFLKIFEKKNLFIDFKWQSEHVEFHTDSCWFQYLRP